MNQQTIQNKIGRSCAVCKFAEHHPNLGERPEVICTVNPNKPCLKNNDDTCLRHELKYKGLKIIVDQGTMLEYDSETDKIGANGEIKKGLPAVKVNTGSNDLVELGDDEWQL